ncbi:MAG TPA: nuclear transport factor 2 family protein [Solirubrobacteraceae bacterium]|nr:nuclear transport factor 2 family protein [Solirubrobacteraceae bacterium]
MSATEDVAREHVEAFNAAVSSGDFDLFVERFSDEAVLRFENVPGAGTLEFAGRAAIAAAYREQPPDDQIDIDGVAHADGETILVPFAWRRDRGRGVMRITRHGDRITWMTISFE